MEAPVADNEDVVASHEIGYVLAIGQAFQDAVVKLSDLYVIDEVARAKLVRIIVRIARGRMRAGHYFSDKSDVQTLSRMAVQNFLRLKAAGPDGRVDGEPVSMTHAG